MNEQKSFRTEQLQAIREAAEKISSRLDYTFLYDKEKLEEFESNQSSCNFTKNKTATAA